MEGAACAWEGGARACGQGGAAGVARRRAAPRAFEGRRAGGPREGAGAPWGLPERAEAPNRAQRRCGGDRWRAHSLGAPVSPSHSTPAMHFEPLTLGWRAGRPNARPAAGRGPATTLRQRIFVLQLNCAPQLTSVCVATQGCPLVVGWRPCTPRASWRRPRVSHATKWALGCRWPGSPAIPHHHTFLCPPKHRWAGWGSPWAPCQPAAA